MIFKKPIREFPVFGFRDSRESIDQRAVVRRCPMVPTEAMIQAAVEAMAELHANGTSPVEITVKVMWLRMWQAAP